MTQNNSRSLRGHASSTSAPRSRACASLRIFARTRPRGVGVARPRPRRFRRRRQGRSKIVERESGREARRELRRRHGRDRGGTMCGGRRRRECWNRSGLGNKGLLEHKRSDYAVPYSHSFPNFLLGTLEVPYYKLSYCIPHLPKPVKIILLDLWQLIYAINYGEKI